MAAADNDTTTTAPAPPVPSPGAALPEPVLQAESLPWNAYRPPGQR
jgi:hypothetical protein